MLSAVQDERLKQRLKENEHRLNNLDIEDLDAGNESSWTGNLAISMNGMSFCQR